MKCIAVSYGLGVDSTAMLIGMIQANVVPDVILFADTGGEKDETYAYMPVMNDYLARHGFPTVTVVRNTVKDFKNWPPYKTLEENCLTNATLPSVAFGWQMKSCSIKWKAAPMHRFLKQFEAAIACWRAGGRVLRTIGFDDSPGDQRRRNHAADLDDPLYRCVYPLQEWHWDRERCKQVIREAGLPVPPKSSCFFCPAMKPDEVRALPADKLRRIVLMEARAKPQLKSIDGLWGTGCKGTRGGVKKPGQMADFILEEGLLPATEVAEIRRMTPLGLVSSEAEDRDDTLTWPEFMGCMEQRLAAV